MTYSIKKESCCNYIINKGKETLFQLNYPSIFSSEAFAITEDGRYFIEKENIWGTRFSITKDEERIGTFYGDWLGRVNIDLVDEDGKLFQIKMKQRGLFHTRFSVYLDNNFHILTMHARYKGFTLNYEIEMHYQPTVNFPTDDLIGLLTYGAHYYMRTSGMS